MKIEDAKQRLLRCIKEGHTHRDYEHVVNLAKKYKAIITGKGIEEYLKRFVQRETEAQFTQRLELTQTITPAISSTVMKPAYKIPRVTPAVKKIDYDMDVDNKEKEKRLNRLNELITGFYGSKSVDDWLGPTFIDYSGIDPNSWLILLFEKKDGGAINPFSEIATCDQAVDFRYRYGELDYIVIKNDIEYLTAEDQFKEGTRWRVYTVNEILEYSQVDARVYPVEDGQERYYPYEGRSVLFAGIAGKTYKVTTYQPKAGFVPVRCLGTVPDLETNGRTFVNLFHAALPYFMKTVKVNSELDLQMTLHTFLQKLSYRSRCKGSGSLGCENGKSSAGKTCEVCHGDGWVKSSSSQEEIELTLPRDPKEMFALDKLVHFVNMPIDIVKFQDECIDKWSKKIMKTVYVSDLFVSDTIASTATEKIIDMDSVYDALTPFSMKYSELWMFIVKTIAVYSRLGNKIIIKHKFPRDFKMKSVSRLLNDLSVATSSGAPSFVKAAISNDIAAVMYADQPSEQQRIRGRQIFDPFAGFSESQIISALSSSLVTMESKVLWSEQNNIFSELEREGLDAKKPYWFYDLAEALQKEKIDEKVQQYIKKIKDSEPVIKPISFGTDTEDLTDPTEVDPAGEPIETEEGEEP